MSSIGERVKEVRAYHKMTQKEFASTLGVSREYICRLEANKESPSYETILLFDVVLNVSTEWLTKGVGEMFSADDAVTITESTKKSVISAIKSMPDCYRKTEAARCFKDLSSIFTILSPYVYSKGYSDLENITDIIEQLKRIIITVMDHRKSKTDSITKEHLQIKENSTFNIVQDINDLFDIAVTADNRMETLNDLETNGN